MLQAFTQSPLFIDVKSAEAAQLEYGPGAMGDLSLVDTFCAWMIEKGVEFALFPCVQFFWHSYLK